MDQSALRGVVTGRLGRGTGFIALGMAPRSLERSLRRLVDCTAASRWRSSPRSRSRRQSICSPRPVNVTVRRRQRRQESSAARRRRSNAERDRLRTDHRPLLAQLLSLDACTKCGKCHAACPADCGRASRSRLATSCPRPAGARRGVLGASERRLASRRRLRPAVRSATRVRAEYALGLHPMHGLCRDLPGRHRARPDHQPVRRRLVEEGELDPLLQATFEAVHSSGQLVRRTRAQARTLDRRPRVQAERHPP